MPKSRNPSQAADLNELQEKDRGLSIYVWAALAGVVLLTVLPRLHGIDRPLFDEHMFREGHSAMMARNYVERSPNIFEPEVDGSGAARYIWLNEFPLYEYLVSLLYRVFGVREMLGRLVSVAASVGAVLLLFRIGYRWQGVVTGLGAAFIFAVAPLSIYQGRSFQRQMLALFLLLLCVDAFQVWLSRRRIAAFSVCALAGMLALLTNIPTAYVGLPLAYLAWRTWGWSFLKRWEMWGLALLILAPPLLWYDYASNSPSAVSLNSLDRETFRNFGSLRYYFEWLRNYDGFFGSIWQQISYGLLTWSGIVLAVWGFMLAPKERGWLPHLWLLAVLIYFMLDVYPIMVQVHDYYFLNALPPLALLAGRGFAWLWERKGRPAYFLRPAAILVFVLIAWTGWNNALPWFGVPRMGRPDLPITKDGYQHWPVAAERMRNEEVCPKDALIVVDSDQPPLLYYCHRRGWGIHYTNLTPETLDSLRDQGAKFLLLTNPEMEMQLPGLAEYLANRCTLWVYMPQDYYVIYQLIDSPKS